MPVPESRLVTGGAGGCDWGMAPALCELRQEEGCTAKPIAQSARRRESPIIVALGLAIGPVVAVGLARFAYALLLPSMQSSLHWTFTVAGAMNTANAVGYLVGALTVGLSARMFSLRRTFFASVGLIAMTLLASASTGNILVQFGLRALSGLFGAVAFTVGASLVAEASLQSSSQQSARMLAIYFGGGGAGIVISGASVPAVIADTTVQDGWRWGWLAMGLLAASTLVAIRPLMRSWREPDPPPAADKRWPMRCLTKLLASYALFGVGYIAYMTFIVAYLKGEGFGTGMISIFWIVLGCSAVAGPIVWAPILARLGGGLGPSLAIAVALLGVLLPLFSRSVLSVLASAILFGGFFLAVTTTMVASARHSLPSYHWPAAIATLTVFFAAGQCVGPVLAGSLSDGKAGLEVGLWVSAAVLAAAALIAVMQRPSAMHAQLLVADDTSEQGEL